MCSCVQNTAADAASTNYFFPQVAEQIIYFPLFAEQPFFTKNRSPTQESNGRPLTHIFIRALRSRLWLVLCIGSNLGLKFGQERPIRVLLPHLAEPKIYK